MRSPKEILSSILEKPKDIDHVRSLVTPDVTYVSLNYSHLLSQRRDLALQERSRR
jgi:uncharacterized protein